MSDNTSLSHSNPTEKCRHVENDFHQPAGHQPRCVGGFLPGARFCERASFHGRDGGVHGLERGDQANRSEEHTSELQSLMRISYAVFCLTTKNTNTPYTVTHSTTKLHTQSRIV